MLQIDNSRKTYQHQTGSLTVYLKNSELYSNVAAKGGGLYLGVESEFRLSDVTVRLSIYELIFAGNIASCDGSAICIDIIEDQSPEDYEATYFILELCINPCSSKCSTSWRNNSVYQCSS